MYKLKENVKVLDVKQITPDMEIALGNRTKAKFSENCEEDGFMTFFGMLDGKGVIQKNRSGDYLVWIEGCQTGFVCIPKIVFETLFEKVD